MHGAVRGRVREKKDFFLSAEQKFLRHIIDGLKIIGEHTVDIVAFHKAIDQKNGKLLGDIVDVAVMVTFTAAMGSTGVIRAN